MSLAWRATAWLSALISGALTLCCLLPGSVPGVDRVDALLPAAPVLAVIAILLAGRSLPALFGAAALAGAGVIGAREMAAEPATAGGHAMVLITYNVARGNRDPAGTAAALMDSDADIVFLQETDGTFASYLPRLKAKFPYGNACRKRCSLAILSRWPLSRVFWRYRDADGRPFGPALLTTTVALPWGARARLTTLHLTRLSDSSRRAAQRDSLAAAVQDGGTDSLVLGGDFNLSPWGASMRTLESGLKPMRRVTRAVFTYPADGALRVPLIPIDHVFAGPAWRIAGVHRLPSTGSDHFPVRVNLLWQ